MSRYDTYFGSNDYLELSIFAVDACNLRPGPNARVADCTSFLTALQHYHGICISEEIQQIVFFSFAWFEIARGCPIGVVEIAASPILSSKRR